MLNDDRRSNTCTHAHVPGRFTTTAQADLRGAKQLQEDVRRVSARAPRLTAVASPV